MAFAPFIFALFVATAVLIALRELTGAFSARGIAISFPRVAVATTTILASAWFGGLPGLSVSIVVAVIALLFFQLLSGIDGFVRNATGNTFVLLYPGFVAGFIFLLARSGEGFNYITTLVILVGVNDTFAYLTGLALGKHPLAPKISPKKTWEGFFGGLVFTSVASAIAFNIFLDQSYLIGALAGVLGVVAATIGDLIESAIKRDLALKDMGTLLPGHGGMLDRLDSALITAPVFWCVIELLKRFG
jgi:phosphatidate cytidylyltransferase